MTNIQSTLNTPVNAVIFDWAGTLVDFGSLAPTQIFVDAFSSFGIDVTLTQAREPMGLSKREHIRQLLLMPEIRRQWLARFSREPSAADIDAVYTRFMPLQIAKVGAYSAPIPGAVATLAWLRRHNIKIGSCSGYPRAVLDVLLPLAAECGIHTDHTVAGDELASGARPGASMALANVLALGVQDVRACVKVDDTVPGIEEGRNAGMWCVGITLSGNEVGCTPEELAQLAPHQLTARKALAEVRLRAAGAHYVIDSVADLPAVIHQIARMRAYP